jgi:hypothetical protein
VVVTVLVEGVVRMFLQTVGLGYVILNKMSLRDNGGEFSRDQDDHLIRLTVTGQNGSTTFVYLSRADADLIAGTLLGLNAELG